MGKYFIRRLLGLIPLFIAVVVISFFLMQFAPGGPEQAMKESKKLTNAQIERWLNAWCLEGEDSIASHRQGIRRLGRDPQLQQRRLERLLLGAGRPELPAANPRRRR